MRKTANSIMFNISEGFARNSNKEFRQYLFIAHGSVAEIQTGLTISLDQNYIKNTEFKDLYQKSTEISKMLSGFIKYLNTIR
jgi:four helix bundle protein